MSYPPPVTPGYVQQPPPGDWTPKPAKSRAVPILVGILIVLVIGVSALGYVALRGDGDAESATLSAFASIEAECKPVAGYRVEDGGQTLILTVGGQFMNTSTLDCVLGRLGMPAAVEQHVLSTRALDGQQTDTWPGYSARWTYHPDDGLEMTIRKA